MNRKTLALAVGLLCVAGAVLAIVNREPTGLDRQATLVPESRRCRRRWARDIKGCC